MKGAKKSVREEKRDTGQYLACPRCRAIVPYYSRYRHQCFRDHLKEMEMDIARMGRTIRI
jgi:uncharacterized C2H2 Zn-finger protein